MTLTTWLWTAIALYGLVMVVTIALGSIPLWTGAEILQATTISGTMVLGLAPVFVLYFIQLAGVAAFHLTFRPGVGLGIAHTAGWRPEWLTVGGGEYASLLGINLLTTGIVFVGFGVGAAFDRWRHETSPSTSEDDHGP